MGLLGAIFKKKKTKDKSNKSSKKQRKTKENNTLIESKQKSKQKSKGMLGEWESTIEKVQNHPLSQARIINTQILSDLTDTMKEMNSKLDKLDELNKLNEIINLLQESKKELEKKGGSPISLDLALAKLQNLSVKDKEALKVIKSTGAMSADEFADKVKLTRSTASTRLNKLYSMGFLKKEAEGKEIRFKFEEQPDS